LRPGPRDVERVLLHRRQRRRYSTAWSASGGSGARRSAEVESTACCGAARQLISRRPAALSTRPRAAASRMHPDAWSLSLHVGGDLIRRRLRAASRYDDVMASAKPVKKEAVAKALSLVRDLAERLSATMRAGTGDREQLYLFIGTFGTIA